MAELLASRQEPGAHEIVCHLTAGLAVATLLCGSEGVALQLAHSRGEA
jgi:hypothetical protein